MIQTVTGLIENEEVQMVLPHEHVLSDLRPGVAPLDNGVFYDKVSLLNHGELTRNPYAVLDNAVLDDRESAKMEFRRLADVGCNLVADATTVDFGRDGGIFKGAVRAERRLHRRQAAEAIPTGWYRMKLRRSRLQK